MKSIKLFFLLAIVAMSTTDCRKGSNAEIGLNAGFQIAGVQVYLSFGTGWGYYYPQYAYRNYRYVNRNPVSVVYIVSPPLNQTSIAVFDQSGNSIGTVSCTGGDWKIMNDFFQHIRNWNYNRPYAVLVEWDPIPFTDGNWSGKIIG